MPIIYSIWMYGRDFNHDEHSGDLFARDKDIISNVPILQKGMWISVNGGEFKIDFVRLEMDYAYEYDSMIDINEEIEIHVYLKFDSFIESCCKKTGRGNGWVNIHYKHSNT
jgi:hypothetical protein